jgi:hypothetical protein
MVIRKKILETHDEMIHTQDVLLDDSFNWMLILKTRFFQPSFFYKKLDIYIFMFFFSSYIKEVFFFLFYLYPFNIIRVCWFLFLYI